MRPLAAIGKPPSRWLRSEKKKHAWSILDIGQMSRRRGPIEGRL